MENLLLREAAQRGELLMSSAFALIALGIALYELRRALQARNAPPQKRRKPVSTRQRRPASVRSAVILLVLISACALYMLIYGGLRLNDFRLDRTEGTLLTAQGVVTKAGRVSKGKSGHYYRILLDTGAEESLSLRIHSSLMDDYAFEEGAAYAVTYYPRTKTLCEAEKLQ